MTFPFLPHLSLASSLQGFMFMAGCGMQSLRDLTPREAKPSALADRFKAPKDKFWLAWHRLRLATSPLANLAAPPPTFGPVALLSTPSPSTPLLSTSAPLGQRWNHCHH